MAITIAEVFQRVTLQARELSRRMSDAVAPALDHMAGAFALVNLTARYGGRRGRRRPGRSFVITFAPIAWRSFVDGDTISIDGPDGRQTFARVLWVENGNQLICVPHRFPLWPALKLLWWETKHWARFDGWRRIARPQDYHEVAPHVVRLPLWWAHPIGHCDETDIYCHDPGWHSPAMHILEARPR